MADKTEIAWADSSFNPWIGCSEVSPACDNCYAREYAKRFNIAEWGPGKPRFRTTEANWKKPLQWNAKPFYECPGCGWRGDKPEMGFPGSILEGLASCPNCDMVGIVNARRRVFCASLGDVFDNEVPDQWRSDLFALIEATPNLDWLLLTKRIGNVDRMMRNARLALVGSTRLVVPEVLPNVWIGATICNQAEADRDMPKLLAVPAAVRFVSMEPLLGPVNLRLWEYEDAKERSGTGTVFTTRRRSIDWAIVGGESGPNARPMHPAWPAAIRDQCKAAGVAFMFKQWGTWAPHRAVAGGDEGGDLRRDRVRYLIGDGREFDGHFRKGDAAVARMDKKSAGRLLDGVMHNEFPR